MPALTEAVIYMLVVLIEILQPTEAITVDYVQNSTPAMVVQITPAVNSDNDVYLIDASVVTTATDTVSFRIEQSDLYAHNYVVYVPGSPPTVIDLSPVRRSLAGVNLEMGAGSSINLTLELDSVTSGPLHLLNRPPYVMLAAPAEAILLIAR
ncbi:MAG: hypothetical protein KAU31_11950 [Spirochaetaceae bacterium]|nr:hypothetical protein [Spirochaetaceae bacterium]